MRVQGLEARDELELQLHDDLSITGAPFGVTEACTIKYGRLRPPERQASSGSPGWKGLWGARKTGPVDLGAVEFVQSFFDDDARGDETTWAATLYSDSRGAYMEGYWSGACEGRFRADKTSEERQRTATRSFSRERGRSGSASPRTPGVGVRSPSRRQGVAKGTLTVHSATPETLVITRAHDGETLVCAFNFGGEETSVELPDGDWTRAADAPFDTTEQGQTVTLAPHGAYFGVLNG